MLADELGTTRCNIHWAGTETATAHAGYIEGAIDAGSRAAREAVEVLTPAVPAR